MDLNHLSSVSRQTWTWLDYVLHLGADNKLIYLLQIFLSQCSPVVSCLWVSFCLLLTLLNVMMASLFVDFTFCFLFRKKYDAALITMVTKGHAN